MSMRQRARSAGAQRVERAKPERAMPACPTIPSMRRRARSAGALWYARTCPLRGRVGYVKARNLGPTAPTAKVHQ